MKTGQFKSNKQNWEVEKETDQCSNETFKLINQIVLVRHTTKGKKKKNTQSSPYIEFDLITLESCKRME